MGLVIPKKIPKPVAEAALQVFSKWRRGEVKPRRANYDRNVLTLDVGRSYRLLCRKGTRWELMSHERYNKALK